ncbi:Rcs stress response system protein RcsF [Thalassotalea sp. Y01]|uniref:Rcs stress response system protein RcsF n=1 Tax=Thalassotalea sp. Y01 TaxID=2729613 RepID=UPI00145DA264|nr:Rcs stress response system protein RcsF [Thalassotalea sp. Y01]NMP15657.1 exopolysaccharide biosynthesis protein [Thalassotalea sp. Y01]
MKTIISLSLTSIFSLMIAGCSFGPHVQTNIDKENFDEYFAATNVQMFTEETLPDTANYLGLVEGNSCKAKANDKPANDIDARTLAREQAAHIGAQAVVFTSCVYVEDPQCIEMKVCYGKAYELK